jgi:hypothetical protein
MYVLRSSARRRLRRRLSAPQEVERRSRQHPRAGNSQRILPVRSLVCQHLDAARAGGLPFMDWRISSPPSRWPTRLPLRHPGPRFLRPAGRRKGRASLLLPPCVYRLLSRLTLRKLPRTAGHNSRFSLVASSCHAARARRRPSSLGPGLGLATEDNRSTKPPRIWRLAPPYSASSLAVSQTYLIHQLRKERAYARSPHHPQFLQAPDGTSQPRLGDLFQAWSNSTAFGSRLPPAPAAHPPLL